MFIFYHTLIARKVTPNYLRRVSSAPVTFDDSRELAKYPVAVLPPFDMPHPGFGISTNRPISRQTFSSIENEFIIRNPFESVHAGHMEPWLQTNIFHSPDSGFQKIDQLMSHFLDLQTIKYLYFI